MKIIIFCKNLTIIFKNQIFVLCLFFDCLFFNLVIFYYHKCKRGVSKLSTGILTVTIFFSLITLRMSISTTKAPVRVYLNKKMNVQISTSCPLLSTIEDLCSVSKNKTRTKNGVVTGSVRGIMIWNIRSEPHRNGSSSDTECMGSPQLLQLPPTVTKHEC